MTIIDIAKICHDANRSLCQTLGDNTQFSWEGARDWQREAYIKGVMFRLNNPDAQASAQHDAWSEEKIKNGWTYGEVKDSEKKTHPCLIPYDQLPPEQKVKDSLFQAIVDATKTLL